MYAWCLGTWLSGDLGRTSLAAGISDPKDPFQPEWFYDCMR